MKRTIFIAMLTVVASVIFAGGSILVNGSSAHATMDAIRPVTMPVSASSCSAIWCIGTNRQFLSDYSILFQMRYGWGPYADSYVPSSGLIPQERDPVLGTLAGGRGRR